MIGFRLNKGHAYRISQASNNITFHIEKHCPIQIDGEGKRFPCACDVTVQFKKKIPIIIGCHKPRGVAPWLLATPNKTFKQALLNHRKKMVT